MRVNKRTNNCARLCDVPPESAWEGRTLAGAALSQASFPAPEVSQAGCFFQSLLWASTTRLDASRHHLAHLFPEAFEVDGTDADVGGKSRLSETDCRDTELTGQCQ